MGCQKKKGREGYPISQSEKHPNLATNTMACTEGGCITWRREGQTWIIICSNAFTVIRMRQTNSGSSHFAESKSVLVALYTATKGC